MVLVHKKGTTAGYYSNYLEMTPATPPESSSESTPTPIDRFETSPNTFKETITRFTEGRKEQTIKWPEFQLIPSNQQSDEIDHLTFIAASIPEPLINASPAIQYHLGSLMQLALLKEHAGNLVDLSDEIYRAKMGLWQIMIQMTKNGIDRLPRSNSDNYHTKMIAALRGDPAKEHEDVVCQMLRIYPKDDRAPLVKALTMIYSNETLSTETFTLEEAVTSLQSAYRFCSTVRLISDLLIGKASNGKTGGLKKINDTYYRTIPIGTMGLHASTRSMLPNKEAETVNSDVRAAMAQYLREIGEVKSEARDVQNLETLLIVVSSATKKGLNIEYIMESLNHFDIVKMDSASALLREETDDDTLLTNLKLGTDGAVDRLAQVAAHRRASLLEKNIEMTINAGIDWTMEISRRMNKDNIHGYNTRWMESEIKRIFGKESDSDGRVKFREAEEYWSSDRGHLPSLLDMPVHLRNVQSYDEWIATYGTLDAIQKNPHTNFGTIQKTMRALWLSDYAGWLKTTLAESELPLFGPALPYATANAEVVFKEADLEPPRTIDALARFNKTTSQHLQHVYNMIGVDQTMTAIAEPILGAAIAMTGIWLGAFLRAGVIAGEVNFGLRTIIVEEMAVTWKLTSTAGMAWNTAHLGRLGTAAVMAGGTALEFSAMTFGFATGATIASIPLSGLPTVGEFGEELLKSAVIFATLELAGFALPYLTGFRASNGARTLNGATSKLDDVITAAKSPKLMPRMRGIKELNGVHELMGYHGTAAGIMNGAAHFASVTAILKFGNIPLGLFGLDDPLADEAHEGLVGNLKLIGTLAGIMIGVRHLKIPTGPLDRALSRQQIAKNIQTISERMTLLERTKFDWGQIFRETGEISPEVRVRELIDVLDQIKLAHDHRIELLEEYVGTNTDLLPRVEEDIQHNANLDGVANLLRNMSEVSRHGKLTENGFLEVPLANESLMDVAMESFNSMYNGVFALEVVGVQNGMLKYRFFQQLPGGPKEPFMKSLLFTPEPDMVDFDVTPPTPNPILALPLLHP